MRIEKLSKGRKKKVILAITILVLLIGIVYITNSKAKYHVTSNIQIVKGKVSYSPYDFQIMAMYKEEDGEDIKIEEMPDYRYAIDEERSYCMRGDSKITGVLKTINGYHTISKLHTNDKCYLYFENNSCGSACQKILNNKTILTRTDFNTIFEGSTTNKIYQSTDDDGNTYYFAGSPTDNFLKFAGFYWRIIRINGNGSIRIIYDGTSIHNNNNSAADREIFTSAFNASENDNMYVGYMYKANEVHGLSVSSKIKTDLDSWYNSKLSSYLDMFEINAGFCNDRKNSTNPSTPWGSETDDGGTGTTDTYYGEYLRNNKQQPTFKCADERDLFTTKDSQIGNNALTYPIGLITMDEVVYAGGFANNTNSFYLRTGKDFWTMTPKSFNNTNKIAYVSIVSADGGIRGYVETKYPRGVRPVLNLKSNINLTGTGTVSDPYSA